jgi:hypothetical protein
MNDPRIYRVTMPDASEWDVPVQTLIEDWASMQTDYVCDTGWGLDINLMAALLDRGHAVLSTPEQIHEYAITIPWEAIDDNDLATCSKLMGHADQAGYAEGWVKRPWKVVTP